MMGYLVIVIALQEPFVFAREPEIYHRCAGYCAFARFAAERPAATSGDRSDLWTHGGMSFAKPVLRFMRGDTIQKRMCTLYSPA